MTFKPIFYGVSLFVSLALLSGNAYAAKIDAYRNIMAQKNFTIKYDVEPVKIKPNKDEIYVEGGKTYIIEKAFNHNNRKTLRDLYADEHKEAVKSGIIAVKGQNRYTETLYNDKNIAIYNAVDNPQYKLMELTNIGNYCLQTINDKFYFISASKKGNPKAFFGTTGRPGAIKPNESFLSLFFTEDVEAMLEANYGNPIIGRILAAIYDDNAENAYTFHNYKLTNEGKSDNGEYYEEYTSKQNNASCAVRFFFNGDKLVRATSVYQRKNTDKKSNAKLRNTVYFKEFTDTPEEKYLDLPKEIEVVRDE